VYTELDQVNGKIAMSRERCIAGVLTLGGVELLK
jgi:hypothetical protein